MAHGNVERGNSFKNTAQYHMLNQKTFTLVYDWSENKQGCNAETVSKFCVSLSKFWLVNNDNWGVFNNYLFLLRLPFSKYIF